MVSLFPTPPPTLLHPSLSHPSQPCGGEVIVAAIFDGGRHEETDLRGFESTDGDDVDVVDNGGIKCGEDVRVEAVAVSTNLVRDHACGRFLFASFSSPPLFSYT